jgi:hypothetical protein
MKIVKIVVPLAFVVLLIGYANELRQFINEDGWPGLAALLICFGGFLACYGVALMPIASKIRARVIFGIEDAPLIASTPRSSGNRLLKDLTLELAFDLGGEAVGWVISGLLFLAGRFGVFLVVAVFSCCVIFAVLMLRRFQARKDKKHLHFRANRSISNSRKHGP